MTEAKSTNMEESSTQCSTFGWKMFAAGFSFADGLWLMIALAPAVLLFGNTVDDSFIITRFAENLVQYGHYGFNLSLQADGATSPLWLGFVSLLATFGLSGWSLHLAQSLLSFVFGALAVAIEMRALSHRGNENAKRGRMLFAIASATSFWLVLWLGSGLETSLAMLLLVVGARFHGVGAAFALALMPWVRPELTIFAFAIGMLRTKGARGEVRYTWRTLLVLFLCTGLSVALFRYLLFGTPLPIAVYAKPGSLYGGLAYVIHSFGLGGLGLLFVNAYTFTNRRMQTVGLTVVLAVSLVIGGGDWMPGFRLIVPALPWALGLLICQWLEQWRRDAKTFFVALVVLNLFAWPMNYPVLSAINDFRPKYSEWLKKHIQDGDKIAAVDIGQLGLEFSNSEIVDLVGIVDPRIAAWPGGHAAKVPDHVWLEAERVDVVLLTTDVEDGPPDAEYCPISALTYTGKWMQDFDEIGTFMVNKEYYYKLYRRR